MSKKIEIVLTISGGFSLSHLSQSLIERELIQEPILLTIRYCRGFGLQSTGQAGTDFNKKNVLWPLSMYIKSCITVEKHHFRPDCQFCVTFIRRLE